MHLMDWAVSTQMKPQLTTVPEYSLYNSQLRKVLNGIQELKLLDKYAKIYTCMQIIYLQSSNYNNTHCF